MDASGAPPPRLRERTLCYSQTAIREDRPKGMTEDRQGRSGDSSKILYCSFCGKSQHEVRKLIAGPSVFICDECVELCNDIIREELEEKAQSARSSLPKPKEILEVLDQYVIGPARAKRTLALAVYNHYKRIESRQKNDDVELAKSTIMLRSEERRGGKECVSTFST